MKIIGFSKIRNIEKVGLLSIKFVKMELEIMSGVILEVFFVE